MSLKMELLCHTLKCIYYVKYENRFLCQFGINRGRELLPYELENVQWYTTD